MLELTLIGIGTGNPDDITLQGVAALAAADLVLLPLKGDDKTDLAAVRRQIIDRHGSGGVPVAEFMLPVRDEAIADYQTRVDAWHDEIAQSWSAAIADHLDPDGRVAVLIWGDPTLYDSSLRIADRLAKIRPTTVQVIPGITAIQALCAAHGIPLNEIGAPLQITTGRNLETHGWPEGVETVVVLLDGQCAFQNLDQTGIDIWWGAYLGMPHQVIEAGPLPEVGVEIMERRKTCRAKQGWIMDTYILRKHRT